MASIEQKKAEKIGSLRPAAFGNLIGLWNTHRTLYEVTSFSHWPLAVWSRATGWVVNSTEYPSPTTRRHASTVRRAVDRSTPQPVEYLRQMMSDYSNVGFDPPPPSTNKQLELFDVSA